MSIESVEANQPFLATGITSIASRGEQAPFQNQSDTPSFWDFLDIVNPLQHLPVVSTIYRAVTGDEIGAVPRIVGGTLYGGPLGLIGAVANEVVRTDTGRDLGEHALAMVLPDGFLDPARPTATAVADAGKAAASANPPDQMTMRAFDAPISDSAAPPSETPPPVSPAPIRPVESQPLPAGAIPNTVFTPLDRPLAFADEPGAPPPSQTAATDSPPQPDKIVPQQLSQTAGVMMAASGQVQALSDAKPPAAEPASEPKKFEAKASSLNHGKMYANAAPYMNKVDPAQRIAQQQGVPANHPMLKAAEGGQSDWMANAMSEALAKYGKAQRLTPAEAKAETTPSS